ncbi:hypothetical protein C0Q70_03201 [Pomacea canaliculata]|uniref:Polypeptide N-acetylgalactosaminyltransferase n=1 Tax=Pomacea canaliculata TaxID=400727 RepID=A0A2T7PS26_POMCA|nr:hypothetical protein C0Q70_03201 [Pomacea canaliculata]
MPRLLRQHHAGGLPVVITAEEFRRQPNSLTGNPLIDTYGDNDWLLAGEMGRGVTFSGEEKTTSEKLQDRWHINIMASDVIPVNRMLPDSRPEGCVHVTFPRELPSTSVVIPFHDEWPSVLLRTVYSVINRTPRHLLQQVVLVDDNSALAALGAPLDQYVRDFFPRDLIRLVRLRQRTGLIASRVEGLRHSDGDVVVFLDSHVEVNVAWLEPLLVEIQSNRQTLAMSTLDYINAHTFEYNYYRNRTVRYGFDWRLFFFELNFRSDQEVSSPHATRPGVVAVGTAFAINRKYFEDLGGYDVGMKIWGGENIELSWRVWLCGGRLVHVPCSRVGHVARTQPYSFGAKGRHMTTMFNYKRAAEVWMGPYRKFVYENFPEMEDGAIIHVQSQLCLDEDASGPITSYCRPDVTSQKWVFTNYVKV